MILAVSLAAVTSATAPVDGPFDRHVAVYGVAGIHAPAGHVAWAVEFAPFRYLAIEAAYGLAFGVQTAAGDKEKQQFAVSARGRPFVHRGLAVSLGAGYAVGAESTTTPECLTGAEACRFYEGVAARWDVAHRLFVEGGVELRGPIGLPAVRFFTGLATVVNSPTQCWDRSQSNDSCGGAKKIWPLFGVAFGGAFG